jgi:hypothetical protein
VNQAHGELGHRLATLRSDFASLGTRAAGAAEALVATLPPPTELLEELTAARLAFADLRSAMVEQAGALSITLEAESLGTLRDLEPVLDAIAAAEVRRVRLAAWEAARKDALLVLERVRAIVHREDRSLPTLTECQGRARELHATLSGPAPEALEEETTRLPEQTRPYTELLALIEGWNVLDDDRCAVLQDTITESFGRTLALAALRGKLGREGEAPPPPPISRTRPRSPVRVPDLAPPEPVPSLRAPVAAAPPRVEPPPLPAPPTPSWPPAPVPVVALAPPPVPPARATPPPAPVVVAPMEAPPDEEELELVGAADGGALLENPGLSGDTIEVEAALEGSEQEEQLERLAQETARWWITARAGWNGLRERGLTFGDAAFDYLKRFPYLMSVPLQQSPEFEGGRLAEGYALLLAHIDQQEEGFVRDALARLNPQFGTRDKDQVYPLSQELYLHVVAEGRLYKTYPDFVREVVQHTVPRPGPWVQGGIVEDDDSTALFMRSERPGSSEEQTRTLTDTKERLGPHLFRVTLGPLTTRFFTLRVAGEALADPPNVEIKLKENDAPTDHAWLVTLPVGGATATAAPRKHRTGGTTLEELGRQFSGYWMGIFNADPNRDRDYELSVILRRKPAPIPKENKPAPERFFGKKR